MCEFKFCWSTSYITCSFSAEAVAGLTSFSLSPKGIIIVVIVVVIVSKNTSHPTGNSCSHRDNNKTNEKEEAIRATTAKIKETLPIWLVKEEWRCHTCTKTRNVQVKQPGKATTKWISLCRFCLIITMVQ